MQKSIQALIPAILLAMLALGVIFGGLYYDTGTLQRMGPGFMPVMLGALLLLLALLEGGATRLASRAERTARHPGARSEAQSGSLPALRARPLICASLSLLLWALVVERVGFIPAAVLQLLLAYGAVRQPDWRAVLLHSGLASAAAFALFVLLLGLPLQALGG
ncbi:MAG TPA: hypothetical protein GX696_08205 [Pseudomonadaceae bacterium]|nr:hypothetical protein [Pseudomonadaceae bacterium]